LQSAPLHDLARVKSGLEDKYPRIQLLSIEELLAGKRVEYPRLLDVTYKKAPRVREKQAVPMDLPLGDEGEPEEPF
jgi:hypothetical protein